MVKVSVVIPCFNDGMYIQEALDSLNAQTYKDFEIIIVDDASTDSNTRSTISEFKQKNLQVIYLEKNLGPAIARNKGVTIAQGEYILPLDADDKIAPTYLEKAKRILDNDNNVGIVYCEADLFGEQVGRWLLPPYSFPDILVENMIFATALFRKSDWVTIGGYNGNMKDGNEDYDFWLSVLELGRKVFRIPEVLFSYRIKKNSRTVKLSSNIEKELESFVQIYKNHEKLYSDNIIIFFGKLKAKNQQIQERDQQIQELKNSNSRRLIKLLRQTFSFIAKVR